MAAGGTPPARPDRGWPRQSAGGSQDVLDAGQLADLHVLDARAGGAMAALVRSYASTAAADVDRLRRALDESDAGTALTIAHRLKGSSANVAAQRVAACCSRLEDALGPGDLPQARAEGPTLEREVADAAAALAAAFPQVGTAAPAMTEDS